MNLKLLSLLAGIHLLCGPAFSQKTGLDIPNFTFHSPNVTNLGQYGDYPVDPSTGVPSIDIPLYIVKGSKLELPLSLSYHASGIKVDQEASFVGLGWVLNAGGIVTRILRDKADESGFGFKATGQSIPDYNSLDDLQGAGTVGNPDYVRAAYTSYDKEPDLFTISANGFNDQFCLDNTGKYVSTGLELVSTSVDHINNLVIVKDKLGNIYRFGKALDGTAAYETTTVGYSSVDNNGGGSSFTTNPSYTSSFYLTEIISADNTDTILFKYKTGMYSDGKVVSMVRYIPNDGGDLSVIDDDGQHFSGITTTLSQTSIPNLQIPDKILFKNGSVEFTTANDRLDLRGGGSLPGQTRITGFVVYDINRIIIKKVVFQNADYFSRTGVGAAMDGMTVAEHRKKSLRLNSVQFYDKNNVFVNDFKFQYDETPLPPRNVSSQDFWGYYNGKMNETLIPETFYTNSFNDQPMYVGDNRQTDYNFMKAGVLKKITYPTGGYTTYDYAPNYYLKTEQSGNKVQKSKTVSLYAVNRLSSCDLADFLNGVPASNVMEFDITEDIGSSNISSANLYVMFSDYKITSNNKAMTYKITNLTNGTTYSFEHTPSEMSQREVINQTITIRKGDRIRLEANTNGVTGSDLSICNSPYIESGLTYNYWEMVPIEQVLPTQAGGLRIKTISNYDINNNQILKKIYEYGDNQYSIGGIGELITDPSKNFYNYPLLWSHITKDLKNILWFSSESQTELGLNKGCPVDYEKVIEKVVSYNDDTPSGKTEYLYSKTSGDYEPKSSRKYPYNTIYYPDWKRGNLLKVVHYKFENANYIPVKSIEYAYNELPVNKIKILKVIDYEPDAYHGFKQSDGSWLYLINNPERFYYYNYYVSCGKVRKQKEIVKEYINGVASLITERNYEYNKYHDVSREWSVNSKSETVETINKYTGDIDYSNLISKNIVGLPIQQEFRVNGKVRSGSILKYNDFGNPIERYQFASTTSAPPVAYNAVATNPPLYERKESLFYDPTKKSLQEIKPENAINTLYLWSYSYMFPIAEIKNADYAVVQSILGTSAIINFAIKNPTPAEVQSFLAPLRDDARLKTAIIATYTFDPLTGVTSMTDNRGQITSFEYDGFGRLKLVKDQNGKILKQYDYQYQKPVTQ
ncbi:RHS repeat domain-containing protein [Chitinophaga sp. GbtcB8]|uniref:RHS repeat domain-containing protein n=1 Tax=Chitinophaga sp. GbtcB8 TaxID=2824753 RepID=UPI001C2FA302|nr:RHS repeat domain-containing protein [Chitinophaga sp. GbtcB8]